MRKFKFFYWLIIIILLVLFFVQNQDFFMERKSLSWNIISIRVLAGFKAFMDYKTPELPVILYFLIYFGSGVLMTFFYSFVVHFKVKRTINILNRTIDNQRERIEELESELGGFQRGAPFEQQKDVIDISADE